MDGGKKKRDNEEGGGGMECQVKDVGERGGPQWALEEEYDARPYHGGVVPTRWPFLSGVREYRPVEIHSG